MTDLEFKENVAEEVETIKGCAGLAYAGMFGQLYRSFRHTDSTFRTAGAESVRHELHSEP